MKKIEQLERKDSAWNKAAMSEPVFVLRANDPVASMVVQYWADMAEGYHEPAKVTQAREVAKDMSAWNLQKSLNRAAERTIATQERPEVTTSIHLQTPTGIVEVKSLSDIPKDAPREVHEMASRMMTMMAGITEAGATPEPDSDDDLCEVCKAAGSEVCLGSILPERSMDILALGLGFTVNEEQTKH